MIIKNIILSSGGIKGISQLGALYYLEENNLLKNTDIFIGVSIGAIIVSLYNIGYSIHELKELSLKLKIDKLQEINIENLFINLGLNDGDYIINILKYLFKKKNYNFNLTFQQLYNITKKKLIIVATSLTDKLPVYFSYENFPNMEIIKALRMSTSIPIYFSPIYENNKIYIDGAVSDIYPIHLFDKNLKNVLGIFTYTDNYITDSNNILNYIYNIYKCFYNTLIKKTFLEKYKKNTIIIKSDTFFFNDINKLKNKLFQEGYDLCKLYFKKNN